MIAKSGKRGELCDLLTNGLKKIKTDEPGTLSIILVEDEKQPDVCYVMERFKDQEAVEAHMKGSADVRDKFAEYIQDRQGIFAKEVAGFVSKDD
jgi:quinol monooxygenase YgiN